MELFIPVCQAVQHAHQKGIIHRDIKPANVLIALYDGKPVPKVIDFGVAKAAGQALTDKTLVTGFGNIIGTLEYMSPEQAEINQLDIDTRSDVYSLGVLLYELLAGSPPFTRKELEKAGMLEMLRVIREQEPTKPSAKLSTAEGLPTLAANRGTEPAKLTKLVRGELDWIVMKALEKDRNRRYESANGFAMDVQRYLADEPVQACPPSAAYRLRKFVRRNRGPVLATALLVALLVGGIIGTTLGLVRAVHAEGDAIEQSNLAEANAEQAEAARSRTREALETMTDDVIEQLLGKQVELGEHERAFLRKVERFFEGLANSQGDTAQARCDRATGYHRVALIRRRLGSLEEARPAFHSAVALWQELSDDYPGVPDYRKGLARSYNELGLLLAARGWHREAEDGYRKALALYRQLAEDSTVPDYRRELAGTQNNLGNLLKNTGGLKEAEVHLVDARTVCKELAGQFPTEPSYRQRLADSHNNLGILLWDTGQLKDAEEAFREAVALGRKLAEGSSRPDYRDLLASRLLNLGNVRSSTAGPRAAENPYREALAVWQKLADDYPGVPGYLSGLAQAQNHLGTVLFATGQRPEAEAVHREALALQKKLAARYPRVPGYRRELAGAHNNLGRLLADTGRLKEAEEAFRSAAALYRELINEDATQPDHANGLAGILVNLAGARIAAGEYREARKLLEQARPYHRRALAAAPGSPVYRQAYHQNLLRMCQAFLGLGDHATAATEAETLARFNHAPPNGPYNAARYLCWCAPLAEKDARLPEARRSELARGYRDRAMGLLRQAVQAGFKNVALMKNDRALEALRGRADWQKLWQEVEALRQRAARPPDMPAAPRP
jgi:tetratricopeptide (TPR) repeat protein